MRATDVTTVNRIDFEFELAMIAKCKDSREIRNILCG